MALQKINWTQVDTENVPSGSIIDLGSIETPLHAVYAENLYLSGTSLSDLIATGGTGGGGAGPAGSSGTSGTSGMSGTSGTSGSSGDRFKTHSSDTFNLTTLTSGQTISLNVETGLSYIVAHKILISFNRTNYIDGDVISYNPLTGGLSVYVLNVTGSNSHSYWDVNLGGAAGGDGSSGTSGTSGSSGSSGTAGTSGSSGTAGSSGSSGSSGTSGSSGSTGTSGTSGTSGLSGTSGSAGTSGTSGLSGTSGSDGSSGTSGSSGLSGSNGTSGTSGTSGLSGSDGTSGTSGSSGSTGTSGTSGSSGTSGTSGQEGHLAKWKFKATTDTSTNPGNNYFALNISSWGNTPTEIAINDRPNDLNGASIGAYLDSIQIGTILKVVNLNDATTYKFLQITQVTPYEFGFEKYTVTQVTSNGVDPNDGDVFTITPIGIPGSLTLLGDTDNGIITLNGVKPYATVESNMSFDGSNLNLTGSAVISNNLTVDGTITAKQLIISSSVTNMTTQFASGSTAFGDTQDDTHNFTGSIYTTGSMVIKGDLRVEGTTTLVQTTDINADSLIISGAMSILKNQIGQQIKSASMTIQNLGTLGDRSNMSTFTVIDCGDGFF